VSSSCFDAGFLFPVSSFIAFLFLGQLDGAQLASVEVSSSGEGCPERRFALVTGGGSVGRLLSACVSTELLGATTLSKAGLTTGAIGEEGWCVVLEAKKTDMESVHHNNRIDDHLGGDRLGIVPVNETIAPSYQLPLVHDEYQ